MRRFALFLSAALVAASAPVLVPATSSAQTPTPATPLEPPAAPGQLLVGYDIGTSAVERAEARSEVHARRLEEVVGGSSSQHAVELVLLPAGADRDAAIRRFEHNPNVAYAEPNWVVQPQGEPDPYYVEDKLWGVYGDGTTPQNQYGSQAGEVWSTGNSGAGVVIGVIDSGVDINHPDLDANIWTNPSEARGVEGVDDDGNGYVDDINGWDFHNGNASVYDPGDGDKHGTHVAGTIAAERDNGLGVVGVAPDATIIPVKFLGPNGGYTSNAIKAVDYLTNLKTHHEINLVASNNSWGGGGYSTSLYAAIERAKNANVLFVAAAGNKGNDNDSTPHYPSSYTSTNVIAVASITSSGERSSFSNYGDVSVDLGAPGSGIWSTLPGNAYASYNGTSMATPHVTGGVALARASGIVGAAALKDAILATAVPTDSIAGITLTGRRLDVSSFAPGAAAPNSAPTAVDDSWTVPAGTSLTGNVLANDRDADLDTLTVTGTGGDAPPVAENGSFTYNASTATELTFTYTVSDGNGGVDTGAVTIKVTQTRTKGGGSGGDKGGGKPSGKGNSTR